MAALEKILEANPGIPLAEAQLISEAIEQWREAKKFRAQSGVLVADEKTGLAIENPALKALRAAQRTIESAIKKGWNLDTAFAEGEEEEKNETVVLENPSHQHDSAGPSDLPGGSVGVEGDNPVDRAVECDIVPKKRGSRYPKIPDWLRGANSRGMA